jgi:hypothetical protein
METAAHATAASLRALLASTVDYAGLFPPATLQLEPALQNYAEYLRSPDAWMLGAFVLPVEQFGAAEKHLEQFDDRRPLRISALGKRTENTEAFTDTLAQHAQMISDWSRKHSSRSHVAQFEMPLPPDLDENLFLAIRSLVAPLGIQAFWEAPAEEAERTIATLAKHNRSRAGDPFGYKLRTGGVVASAFPDTAKVARALVSAAKNEVPIKFTAGLHHPVRRFHDSVATKMHGFLNVLGAGVLTAELNWNEDQTVRMLEDEDADAFRFTEKCMRWRDFEISTERIASLRKQVTSFGSCSFDEPRDDLRALSLL